MTAPRRVLSQETTMPCSGCQRWAEDSSLDPVLPMCRHNIDRLLIRRQIKIIHDFDA